MGNKSPFITQSSRPELAGWGPALPGFVAGVALQLQQRSLDHAALYASLAMAWVLIPVVLLMHARAAPSQRNLVLAILMVIVAGALSGFGLTGWRATAFQAVSLAPAIEGRDVEVTGLVLAMPQRSEDALRFRFRIESARLDGQAVTLPRQILLGWYATFGGRELPAAQTVEKAERGDDPSEMALTPRQPQSMRAGERWQMTVRLKAPHGNSNPHGFDYELWLWEQGLQATGYVRAGAKDPAPARLSQGWNFPVERARQAAREAIYAQVTNRQLAGIVAALVVGDQNAIERADWDVFRATGVAHLMSISGLHITMFAWAASLLVGGLWRQSTRLTPRLCLWLPAVSAGAIGGLLLATGYALFSGWGVPAQRTVCMLATITLLRLGGRQWPWHATWLAAMAVVLLVDPWAILQAGFWLSFIAVGILFAAGLPDNASRKNTNAINSGAARAHIHWAEGRFDAEKWPKPAFFVEKLTGLFSILAGAAREQWVVTLALTPMSLLLFNQMSLVGLLANAVAIPWVTLVVTPVAMLGLLWAPLWDVAAWGLGLLSLLLQWLAGLRWASVSVASAPLGFAVAGVVGGALLALRLPWHWRLLGAPLLLPVLLWQTPRPLSGQFELLAADIGQGNAILVRTASHALLYDTGPRFSRESDAGHRVLVPLLRAIGEPLDTVVISHRDADHIGGAPAVLAMQPQAALLASIEDSHELQALRKATRCIAGQHWEWDGVMFDILHPLAADYDAAKKSNAMSCVLRISNGNQTALLTGDIEAEQELRLVADEKPDRLKADVLLVPHHGSKTSSTAQLLDAVQPRIALAQAGYRNRFGHPVASVVARYEERGIRLVKSPQCGAATWRSADPERFTCQRTEGKRYWHHTVPP